jgi:hypothetical protein
MGMSFMKSFRGFMIRASVEMLIKIRRKIRCGIRAEGDDSSAYSINIGWIGSDVL